MPSLTWQVAVNSTRRARRCGCRYRPATRKTDGYRPEVGASDAQLLAFVLFVGEGAHPWVGGLLGFPCLSLGPPAGAPNKDNDVVNRIYIKKKGFLGTALPFNVNVFA